VHHNLSVFEQSHYSAAHALWLRTPGVGLSAADKEEPIARYLARNPGLSFVAEMEGDLVGTVLCGHDGRRGLVHHLVVAPEHQRHGIGRALLMAGLEALRNEYIDKCHLLVFRSNGPGIAFWHAVGAQERLEIALFSCNSHNDALAQADPQRHAA